MYSKKRLNIPVWLFHLCLVLDVEAIFDGEGGNSAYILDRVNSQSTGYFVVLLSALGVEKDSLGGENEGDKEKGNGAQDDQGDDPRVAKGNAQGKYRPDKGLNEGTNAVASSLQALIGQIQ